MVIYYPQSHISLNNKGDKIFLINPCGEIVAQVKYGKSLEGQSWAMNKQGDLFGHPFLPQDKKIDFLFLGTIPLKYVLAKFLLTQLAKIVEGNGLSFLILANRKLT